MCFNNVVFVSFGFFFLMVDVKEQHVCIKFCFELGKSAAKHTNCLNKDLVMTLWVRRKPVTCLTSLKVAKCQLIKTTILDSLNSVQYWKMLQKCLRLSVRTVSKRSMSFAIGLLYGTCQSILSDKLNVRQIAAKFILGC